MKRIVCVFFFVILIFVLTCANQGFPPGGPEDRTPPFILRTFPAPDSTNIPLDVKVVFEFSEAVNPNSCQEALFITPFPGEKIKYQWKRDKQLTILFGDSLFDNRTYVITIGAGTKDQRNNAMKNSFSLAFSTGAVLDKGRVSGFVYGDGVEGTQIWAYDLADTTTPNPSTSYPLYITQTGTDGIYQLTNMALSNYRLFAVMDRDVNNKYNVEYDKLGIATRDIRLDSANFNIENFNFRITKQDTTPPQVSAALASDQRHVDIRFAESMLPDCLVVASNYTIRSENDSLSILNASIDFINAAVVHLATSEQDSGKEYKIVVKKGYDLGYNALLPDSNVAFFTGSAIPDTIKPTYIAMLPRDSSKFVLSYTPLHLYFSEAMRPEPIVSFLVVADTLGDTIKGEITWPEKSHYMFYPKQKFESERFYVVSLPVDSVVDMTGNTLADTLFERQFLSINPDTLTAISGQMTDEDSTAVGPIFMRAVSADEKKTYSYDIWIDQPGLYKFDNMLPGSYTIELYRDEDVNGRFNYGGILPFQPAERFWIYPDTIKIRARWPNEGENIILGR